MKIQTKKADPSAKVSRLIDAANAAKMRVLDYLDIHPMSNWGVDYVRACLRFSDVSFAIYADEAAMDRIDRTKSIIAGPLYVSKRHPYPIGANGKGLYPVLQIDMAWVSLLTGKKFEQCLLQFWWDTFENKAYLRKLPFNEVNVNEQLPIDVDPEVQADGELWMPESWILEGGTLALQIAKCSPIGVTYPGVDSGRDSLIEEYGDELDKTFLDDLETFSKFSSQYEIYSSSKKSSVAKLFGSFYACQLAPDEFLEEGCLMNMDWATGSGIIFYTNDPVTGQTDFRFYFDN